MTKFFKKQVIEQTMLIGHPYPDPNVLISHKERFLWCSVPKAASTSWKAYFIKHYSGKGVDGMGQIDQQIQPLMSSPRCGKVFLFTISF